MSKKIMRLPLLVSISALLLSACGGSGHNDGDTLSPNYSVGFANASVYGSIKADAAAASLFTLADTVAGSAGLGTDLCDVKIVRLTHNTVGGAGESTTSSGVAMVPQPTNALSNC